VSHLIAITYPDEATARSAAAVARGLTAEREATFEDMAIAVHQEDDHIRLVQHMDDPDPPSRTQHVAKYGAFIGATVVAPLLFGPFAVGMAIKDLHDHGIKDRFMKEVAESLERGSAVLFALVSGTTPEAFTARLAEFGGTVVHTELDDEQRSRLADAKEAVARGEDPQPAGT
jgi:uncharacterized membrane protein